MLFRCLVILFCLTTTFAQKGGRQGSASEDNSSVRSPSRILANRKIPQPSEPIQQVQEPEDRDPDEDREIVQAVRPRRPPAPRPQQPVEEEGHEPAPEPYSFSYSVDDPETGAASSREETQDANGEIVGYYHIKDADGRTRRVDYTAGKDGFKATIKSNEEGLNARAPADVSIELSASPSETRPSYAPNNRPAPTETSIKSFGRPTQGRFFDRLIPALPSPIPPPIPQQIEQTQEPLEAQISQTYESNDPSESLEIVQQKNIDEELPVESTPIKGPPQPPQPPIQRPIGRFTPQRLQTYRENALVSLEPVITPIAQVKEEVSNSIQDSQQTAESLAPLPPPPSTKGLLQQSYSQFRPLSPILGTASIPLSPKLIQYQQTPVAVQQSVPNLAPLSPPSNNIVTQQREPIVQERLFNYLNTLPLNPVIQSPQYIVASPQPQPLVYSPINRLDNSYVRPQLINTGYRLNIQHNAAQIPQQTRQEVLVQEKVDDLPSEPIQQRQPSFEPQIYEPLQQTYEPLQQEAEDPAEESRAAPPSSPQCECPQQTESIVQSVKGSPSEPAPVKIGRLSPFYEFIPQAFRTR